MSVVEAYLYSNCSSCKKADALLSEQSVEATRRDIFKDKMSADEIKGLFQRTGLTVADALSTRSRPYSELKLSERALNDDEIIELMSEFPALLKRPIIVNNGRAVVGFKRDAIIELIQAG